MRKIKVSKIVKDLTNMEEEYDNLKLLIRDQITDDEISEAETNFRKLIRLKNDIRILENTEVEEVSIERKSRI